jgi:hypothetical protein
MKPSVVRIWTTGLDNSRERDYEEFARNISLPMFRRHDGFLGVLFAGVGEQRTVITLWRDRCRRCGAQYICRLPGNRQCHRGNRLPPLRSTRRTARRARLMDRSTELEALP